MAGDGQVTAGNTIAKGNATKVRKIYDGKVLTGFAGSVADAFTLLDKFEAKLKEANGDLTRAAVELAKMWRTEKMLQKLEAQLLVADKNKILLISGDGNVIEPENRKRRKLRLFGRVGLHGVFRLQRQGNRAKVAWHSRKNLHLHKRPCYGGGTLIGRD